MLLEIRCEKFASEHQRIRLRPGLNTVLGSTTGSNAIGKSTFLWIVDYAFGGEIYYTASDDIKKEIGAHTVYFTFLFDGAQHYFYRNTDDPKHVSRCDGEGHLIETISLDEYRKFLYQEYKIGLPLLSFSDISERFFRIYGRENTLEKYPLHKMPREYDEKAVDFLMKLFGVYGIVEEIQQREAELGLSGARAKKQSRLVIDPELIESNQKEIEELNKRLKLLIRENENVQLNTLGFNTEDLQAINNMRRTVLEFSRKRAGLVSQLAAIEDNVSDSILESAGEFDSLLKFFPNADIKAFTEIEYFHKRIREILSEEMEQEAAQLRQLVQYYDDEIQRAQKRVEKSGLAKEMSESTLTQCINVSKQIDKLEDETAELIRQVDRQERRAEAERQLESLLRQQVEQLEMIQGNITHKMSTVNDAVTEDQETAPFLKISRDKEITFATPGNTSEGAAYKGLVLYDLSILALCPIPAMIHDSNILKRIEDAYLEHILEQFQKSSKQIFIAFDKAEATLEPAHNILESTTILRLSDGHELFGRSWSKRESGN